MRYFLLVDDAILGQVVQRVDVLEFLQRRLQCLYIISSLGAKPHAFERGRREEGRGGGRGRERKERNSIKLSLLSVIFLQVS